MGLMFMYSYGVALPYDGDEEINENFANARIYSNEIVFDNQNVRKAIILTTSSDGIEAYNEE